jgi:hypothetical protein
MPDLHVVGHGTSLWAEIKQKDRILDTRARSQEEHGIDKPNWEHYRRLANESGVPVWLFIFEEPTGALLAGDISQLTSYPPIDEEKCKQYYGNVMTFVSREDLTQVRLLPEHIPPEYGHEVDIRAGTLLPVLLGFGGGADA